MPKYRVRRFDIINYLVKNLNLKSYLEIGVNGGWTYDKIDIEYKECCDPVVHPDFDPQRLNYHMNSDEAFSEIRRLGKKFDIVYIDGFHEKNQVFRDIINSLEILNENGVIVTHDCSPPNQLSADIRKSGNCYQAIVKLKISRPEITLCVVNTDLGCGIISGSVERKGAKFSDNSKINEIIEQNRDLFLDDTLEFSWGFFDSRREDLINRIEVKDLDDWLTNSFNLQDCVGIMEYATGPENGLMQVR
ncbi:MAG: class I SAM-dependent methyltransferase [Candidatus Thermoplasmatota archaeon]|nr:class I SAM-dependent methyltransferase [Candidatus Thermoplasmatota archaeon]